MWAMAIPAIAGAVLGYDQQRRQAKATEKFNKGQAEVTRYSPWTGVKGQIQQNNADPISGALQGGLSGAMFGQQLSGMNAANNANAVKTAQAEVDAAGEAGSSFTAPVAMNTTQMNKPPTMFDSMRKSNPYRSGFGTGYMAS